MACSINPMIDEYLSLEGDPSWLEECKLDWGTEGEDWSGCMGDTDVLSCGDSSPAGGGGDTAATMILGAVSPSRLSPWGGEVDEELGWEENTKNWGRPWTPDRFLWPSLLAPWRARPMAAAAARCWSIRSSRSASLAPAGSCIEKKCAPT